MDKLKLYRQDGLSTTLLASSLHESFGINPEFRVRVNRDINGNWEILCDSTGGNNFIYELGATDLTHTYSTFSGLWSKHTSSNNDNFYFDDIISKLGDKGFSIAGLLINHLKTSLTDDIKKKVRGKNNYILNNHLDFKTEIKFATLQIKVFLMFLFKLDNNQLKRRINLLISGYSISRSTFLNIRLSSVFKNLINFHNPKLVFIT